MNEETKTKEYFEKLKGVKLSETSRTQIESELLAHAQFHPVREGVRVSADGRSIGQVPRGTSLLRLKFTYMPLALLIAVFVSGGVAFAAEGAVPGDTLYPIKTEVNESLKSAIAIGANAETRLQTKLLAERLTEANELQTENKLNGETGAVMKAGLIAQVEKTADIAAEAAVAERVAATEAIVSTLASYNMLVQNDTALAIAVDSLNISAETRTALSTSMVAEPVAVSVLAESTKVRATALKNLLVNSSSELSTSIQTSLEAKLNTALEITSNISLEAETEARAKLLTASELVGEVEATLTALGTAKIDTNTGAILDIDFNDVPAVEYSEESEATDESTADEAEANAETEIDASLDTNVNTGINNDRSDIEADASLNATGGISL